MSEIMLCAENIETTYENFIAMCPECGHRNIFNRISDLKTTQPISFKKVHCFKCDSIFGINRDRIQARYIAIFFDCYLLYQEKRYSTCILLLTQALEVFFYHYLKVELIYRPFWNEKERDFERLNRLLESLQSSVESMAYGKLKNVFLACVIDNSKPKTLNLDDSKKKIDGLRKYAKKCSKDDDLRNISNSVLVDLLIKLRDCKIHQLRNKVVHKEAYRPHCEEVKKEIEEVRELLVKISSHLDVFKEDINYYR